MYPAGATHRGPGAFTLLARLSEDFQQHPPATPLTLAHYPRHCAHLTFPPWRVIISITDTHLISFKCTTGVNPLSSSENKELTEDDERVIRRMLGEEVMLGVETRWKPGVSGNPAGRPAEPDEATLTEWLIHVLGKTGAKSLAQELIGIAKSPGVSPTKLAAIQYIYDRIEGKPRQAITTTGGAENPLVTVLRRITDDRKALEGHVVPALPAKSLYETLDGAGDSEDTGVTV